MGHFKQGLKYLLFFTFFVIGNNTVQAENIDSLLSVLKAKNDLHQRGDIHQKIGNQYYYQEKFNLAENHMVKAASLYADDTNSFVYNQLMLALSGIYSKQELFNKALSYALRSKKLAELYGRDEIIGLSSLNASTALKELAQNQWARELALEAFAVFEKLKDSLSMAYACNTLGMISKNLEDYSQAEKYYQKSLAMRQQIGSTSEVLVVLGNLGILHKLQGNYDSSFQYFKQAGQIAEESGSDYFMAANYLNLAEMMLDKGDTMAAMVYSDSSLAVAERNGFLSLIVSSAEMLADLYYAKKNYDLAWKYNHQFLKFNDSILELDRAMVFDQLQLFMENSEKEAQIEQLKTEQIKNVRVFHIVIVTLLVIVIILIYLRSQRIKKSRDLLDKSERKFRMLAENSVEVLWSCDLDLKLTYISPSTETLFGYTRDERMEKSMAEIYGDTSHDLLKSEVDQKIQELKKGATIAPILLELKGRHKNGSDVWVEIAADFTYDEKGKARGLQGIARNITKRKTAELETNQVLEDLNLQDEELKVQNEELIIARQELEKTAEQYFDLFENGPVGYLILNEEGKITEVNSTSAKMIGLKKDDILNKYFLNYIHQNEKPEFSACFIDTIKNSKVFNKEFNINELTARIVFVPDILNNKVRCRLAMIDVTAEVQARESLSVALNSMQTVFDAIPGCVLVIDSQFRVMNLNKRLLALHNLDDPSVLIGKDCKEVFKCNREPGESCTWDKVLETGKTLIRHSSPDDPVYKSGNYRIYSSPMLDKDGNTVGVVEAAMDITDLKKAEFALADSERKFKDLFNDIPDAVFITGIEDKSGEIVDVNAAAEKQTGYSRSELLRMNVLRDISILKTGIGLTLEREANLKSDDKIELTEQKRCKDGRLIWTEVVVQRIVIDGEVLALSVSRDITDRVTIQEELKTSESRLRSLLSALPDMLFIFDRDENFMEYHVASPEGLITTPEKFLDKNLHDILPDYLAKITSEKIKIVFETGEMQVYNYHMDTPKGRCFYDARMVKASENTVLTIVRDITGAHKAEEDRRQNEEKYRTIFMNTPLGVFNFDSKGVILDCNDHFVKILGSSREVLIGFDMLEQLEDLDLKRTIKQVIESGSGTYQGDYKSVTSGKVTPIRAFFKTIYTANHEFIDGIGIVEDVSEQRENEEKLLSAKQLAEQSDKLKSSFMATMSHELRTPLNTVIGFSDMIEESMPIDQILEFTQVISRSGKHLLSIIEDILDISLIDSGETKLVVERFYVGELMEGLINFAQQYRLDFNKHEIEILSTLDDNLKEKKLSGDVRKLNKVFGHLIKNAIKFTRQGKIEIGIKDAVTSPPDFVLMYVKDTGIGIPKDKHDIIFEIFRQVDDSSTREFEGTGLGLSISKKLINMMGGRIWLDSEPGKGSTFYFELPLKAGAAQTIERFNKYLKPKVKTMKGITVLVAEDDDTNFHLFKLLLTRRQIEVIRARNGEESVNFVSSNPDIKMVLMDINMPILNGYEATKKIKELRSELPVIAVTAYAMVGDKERAEEAGCDDYITKPINNQIFYDTISKYL